MSDLPPDLPRLRTLETWLVMTLQRVRERITAVEQHESERQRGATHRPRPPDWALEMGIGRDHLPVYVHVGGCHMTGGRSTGVPRQTAVRALTEGVEACPHCRPDTELGVLD
ncbi:DUF6233 domain-containing protein [Streptomyces sp. NPDC018833]|uniref:DUF6233 domain-containing protein n=1 Tax=Streptomyces sp. NPDC018833 TaxID=3365053 RepID=UPI0037A7F6ED